MVSWAAKTGSPPTSQPTTAVAAQREHLPRGFARLAAHDTAETRRLPTENGMTLDKYCPETPKDFNIRERCARVWRFVCMF